MPPTNDTGSVLTVGPDVDGNHFDVLPGEDYTLPAPPRTVTDDEAEAAEEPLEAVETTPAPTKRRVGKEEAVPAPADTEGNQE